MSGEMVIKALQLLKDYFKRTVPKGTLPKVIFHGAEPLLNRKALFSGIEKFSKGFTFGLQTNGVLFDAEAAAFLKSNNVSIGISLDGPTAKIANKTRTKW